MCIDEVVEKMKWVFTDVPYGIEHTQRVWNNATSIMDGEDVVDKTREIVSLAAILHDIGAVEAQRKYGSMEGRFQEIEGPPIAQPILERAGVPREISDRVCYIVGHHHTPAKIDGVDFQILWEADYLEYLQFGEGDQDQETLRRAITENFRTTTGRHLACERLGLT